jgi:hypothetical protein
MSFDNMKRPWCENWIVTTDSCTNPKTKFTGSYWAAAQYATSNKRGTKGRLTKQKRSEAMVDVMTNQEIIELFKEFEPKTHYVDQLKERQNDKYA